MRLRLSRTRDFFENNFNLVLIAAFIAGLVVPGLPHLPNWTILVTVGAVIFFSFSRLEWSDIGHIKIKEALFFYLCRYIILPLPPYFIFLFILPDYALAVLLLSLMPAGVAVMPLTIISRGNGSLALSLTVISTLLAPFLVPFVFAIAGHDIDLNIMSMFGTLVSLIFIPILVFFIIVRPVPKLNKTVKDNGAFLSVVNLALMLMIVIAKQREYILSEFSSLVWHMAILFPLFFVFYLIGWFIFPKIRLEERISYAYGSGAMNNVISISLAFLYFNPEVALIMVLTEIPWVLSIPVFQAFLHRYRFNKNL